MGKRTPNPRPAHSAAATKLRVGVLVARYNADITAGLLRGAAKALAEIGVKNKHVEVHEVPGCFELPLVARALAKSRRVDAVIALGCVIEGDTDHYQHVCEQTASGLMRAGLDGGIPIAFGVLTTKTRAQALARAKDDAANKGAEAAAAAVETVLLLEQIRKR